MEPSRTLTTTSFAVLLAGFGLIACGGAEVEPSDQAQSAGLTQDKSASPPAGETLGPERQADERGPGRHRRHGPPSPERMIERFDANDNGTLEAGELPERMQEHIAEIDTSGDSVVSKEELAAHMKSKFMAHAKRRFEKKDANKDGTLDESELGELWSKFSVADQNGDKKLTPEELRTAFESGKIERPMHGKRWKGEKPAAPSSEPAPAAPAL